MFGFGRADQYVLDAGDIETVLERYMVSLTPERNEH